MQLLHRINHDLPEVFLRAGCRDPVNGVAVANKRNNCREPDRDFLSRDRSENVGVTDIITELEIDAVRLIIDTPRDALDLDGLECLTRLALRMELVVL